MNIKQLLSTMTLEEKLAQMTQLPPNAFFHESLNEVYGSMREMTLSEKTLFSTGSILGISNAREMKRIQDLILETSRLKIPALFMADIIHGYETIFPIPLAQAASFNDQLPKKINRIASIEASTAGIHVSFAPMVDLSRDARWGRVMEGYGEDPILSSRMGVSAVLGFQDGHEKDETYVAACVKHFASYGAAEAGRDYNTVDMSYERFYNLYQKSYQAAIDAGAKLVMLSFNTFNGIPVTIHEYLVKTVLRQEMGFEGVIISDYDALHQVIAHGAVADDHHAAIKGLKASLDIEMGSNAYLNHGVDIIKSHPELLKAIDASVYKILKLKDELGLFENPYKNLSFEKEQSLVASDTHMALSYEYAKESIVLLKNQDVLPLNQDKKIALIGPFINDRQLLGAWHWHGNDRFVKTYLEVFDDHVGYTQSSLSLETMTSHLHAFDVAILMVGEVQRDSGESRSKVNLDLDPEIKEVIAYLKDHQKQVIVVVHGGRPLILNHALEADAILMSWFLGHQHARVVKDTLYGLISPTGKLPMSFPRHVGQYPMSYHDFTTGRPYDPVHNEYVTKYVDVDLTPLFPFGYGLTYGQLELNVHALPSSWDGQSPLEIDIELINHHDKDITETIQLYYQLLPSIPVRGAKRLFNYKKITVPKSSHVTLQLSLDKSEMTIYDEHHRASIDPGILHIYIGFNSLETTHIKLDWSPQHDH
jgi:beta-glucosidase